jgi:hypothetical protein
MYEKKINRSHFTKKKTGLKFTLDTELKRNEQPCCELLFS